MKKIFTIALLSLFFTTTFSQIKWTNPLQAVENVIKGRGFSNEISDYSRLPLRVKETVREPLWNLSQNSAGLSICFTTNSKNITVRYGVSGGLSMGHMPATGVSGIDLYTIDQNGTKYWLKGFYNFSDTIKYHFNNIKYNQDALYGQEFELFLPLYNSIKWLEIGVDEGSEFEFIPVTNERPIVVYGTSIAQGACASRPAMAWTNILARQSDNHVINLGFSGNGRLESEMFDLIKEIEAKLYIIDCMPNMTGDRINLIFDRTIAGVKNLRSKSSSPILLVEHSGYMNEAVNQDAFDNGNKPNIELKRAYDSLINIGVEGLHYMKREEFNHTMDCQVDGVHPTDLGMQQAGDAYTKVVNRILNQTSGELSTQKPLKQDRDAFSYTWNNRHQNVIQHNVKNQPEILMVGNSITHFWGEQIAQGRQNGKKVWDKMFKKHTVSNMGYGWDRIENVLHRVYHGELDGFNAKQIFLLIGCNNLAVNTNVEIVKGLDFLVKAIRVRQPKAQIYIQHILPRKDFEQRISELNQQITTHFANSNVILIDSAKELLNNEGSIKDGMFYDGVHPTEAGYRAIAPYITRYLK